LISERTCMETSSSREVAPCSPELLIECKRSWPRLHPQPWRSRSLLRQSESTPSGSEAPSWPLSLPSSECGVLSRSTTRAETGSFSRSASKHSALFDLFSTHLDGHHQPPPPSPPPPPPTQAQPHHRQQQHRHLNLIIIIAPPFIPPSSPSLIVIYSTTLAFVMSHSMLFIITMYYYYYYCSFMNIPWNV